MFLAGSVTKRLKSTRSGKAGTAAFHHAFTAYVLAVPVAKCLLTGTVITIYYFLEAS
jgi:hypothetical protein